MLDWIASAEFDGLLVETVRATYPKHEQEQFLAHFRGLLGLWVHERGPDARRARRFTPESGASARSACHSRGVMMKRLVVPILLTGALALTACGADDPAGPASSAQRADARRTAHEGDHGEHRPDVRRVRAERVGHRRLRRPTGPAVPRQAAEGRDLRQGQPEGRRHLRQGDRQRAGLPAGRPRGRPAELHPVHEHLVRARRRNHRRDQEHVDRPGRAQADAADDAQVRQRRAEGRGLRGRRGRRAEDLAVRRDAQSRRHRQGRAGRGPAA